MQSVPYFVNGLTRFKLYALEERRQRMASPTNVYAIWPLNELAWADVVSNPPNRSHMVSCQRSKRWAGDTLSVEMVTNDGIDSSK